MSPRIQTLDVAPFIRRLREEVGAIVTESVTITSLVTEDGLSTIVTEG